MASTGISIETRFKPYTRCQLHVLPLHYLPTPDNQSLCPRVSALSECRLLFSLQIQFECAKGSRAALSQQYVIPLAGSQWMVGNF